MNTVTVTVKDRLVNNGKTIVLGMEDDNNIDQIVFDGLPEGGDKYIVGTVDEEGTGRLTEITDSILVLTDEITRSGGILTTQIIVTTGEDVWHSKPFRILVGDGVHFTDEAVVDETTVAKLLDLEEQVSACKDTALEAAQNATAAQNNALVYQNACGAYAGAAKESAEQAKEYAEKIDVSGNAIRIGTKVLTLNEDGTVTWANV